MICNATRLQYVLQSDLQEAGLHSKPPKLLTPHPGSVTYVRGAQGTTSSRVSPNIRKTKEIPMTNRACPPPTDTPETIYPCQEPLMPNDRSVSGVGELV